MKFQAVPEAKLTSVISKEKQFYIVDK